MTAGCPPKMSLLDMIAIVTGAGNPACVAARLRDNYPKTVNRLDWYQFPGQGQRIAQVVGAREAAEIIFILPGKDTIEFRRKCSAIVCRHLGGDETIVADALAQGPLEEPTVGSDRKRFKPESQTLYVVSLEIPGIDDCISRFGYKIGRTSDLEPRLGSITGSLPCGPALDLAVHAVFPNAGHLEPALHRRFRDHLVETTRSKEWFRVSLAEILSAIAELKAG
jgi:hypothetical protein